MGAGGVLSGRPVPGQPQCLAQTFHMGRHQGCAYSSQLTVIKSSVGGAHPTAALSPSSPPQSCEVGIGETED